MTESWWEVEENCPECGGFVGTNGEYRKCYDCGWSTLTMQEAYGDGSDHMVCGLCGCCKDCGDCDCE